MPELSYDDSTRILKEVILGTDKDPNDTPEEAAWRQQCYEDVQDCYAKGVMPEIPPD